MRLRLFVRFLKTCGLYEEYLDELKRFQGVYYSDQFLLNRLARLKPNRYIVAPISWRETSRGHYFWSMVNDAWLDYLNYYTSKN